MSIELAYWLTSAVCVSDEVSSVGPPESRFNPRSAGPGSVGAGHPSTPYWAAVASPAEAQPGVSTGLPSTEPTAASAFPLTIRLHDEPVELFVELFVDPPQLAQSTATQEAISQTCAFFILRQSEQQ